MNLSQKAVRFLRFAGLLTWVLAGMPLLQNLWNNPGILRLHPYYLWLGSYIAFGVVFTLTPWAGLRTQPNRRGLVLIGVQTILALLMIRLVCTGYEGALLVVVSLQLGWMLPLPLGLAWVIAHTLLMAWLVAISWPVLTALALVANYAGFEALALFSAYFAASESRSRAELGRTNAELQATRELVAETSRIAERQRISRELHDVLGHNLTALSLNLEVATHTVNGSARDRVEKARDLTKGLLNDVRDVVRTVRGDDRINLKRSVETLIEGVPQPRIHLTLPDDLEIDDPLRAQTLLRCAQEIVTNAIRHANARNLWIEFSATSEGVEVRARDDGRGVRTIHIGNGLKGMRERLERFGGKLQIESGLSQGFELHAWIPLHEVRP